MLNKVKIILVSISLLMLCSFAEHEYYVSIANVNLNTALHQLEVELKLDADDFEVVLNKETSGINLDKITPKTEQAIEKYLQQHFVVWANGGRVNLELVGEELNPDGEFYCYFLLKIPTTIHSIKIKNDILLPMFLQQHNIVNLKTAQKTYSHTFIQQHTTYTFKIDAK